MAVYNLSEEGAREFQKLAAELVHQMDEIIEAGSVLESRTSSLEGDLGVYGQEIKDIVLHNRVMLQKNYNTVVGLADAVSKKGREMLELLEMSDFGVTETVSTMTGSGMQESGRWQNGNIGKADMDSKGKDRGIQNLFRHEPAPHLKPDRKTPRNLPDTQFGFQEDETGNLVYDSPMEMDHYLCKNQGWANPLFQGTCGLCSCANILRLAGVNMTEKKVLSYAAATTNQDTGEFLCTNGSWNIGNNGSTTARDRQLILEHFGMDSSVFPIETDEDGETSFKNIERIAKGVSEGRGVIISVFADMLWDDKPYGKKYHAVTVTSVKKDKSGNILGFYICDSARGGTSYYSAEKVRSVLTGNSMNVTGPRIR